MTPDELDLERVEALLDLGRADEALRRLAGLVADAPDDSRRLVLLARALLDAGRGPEGLAAANRAVAADPGDQLAHRLAAAALLELEQYAEAVRAAREAIRLAPYDEWNHVLAAYALASHAQAAGALDPRRRAVLRQARAAAGEALRLAPDAADAHAAAGFVAFVGGPRHTAVASFQRALQIDPHHAVASNNLGAVRVNTYRWLQAGQALSAALSSDPSLESAKGNLALLLRRGLIAATALSLIVVFLLTIPLERELDGGSRAWRTAAGAACLSLLLWVAYRVSRLPRSVRRYFRLVLRRRPLHQALALVALVSTTNALLVLLRPGAQALDLAYVHIGVAAVVIPVILFVGVVAAALRGARSVGALLHPRSRRRQWPRDRSS